MFEINEVYLENSGNESVGLRGEFFLFKGYFIVEDKESLEEVRKAFKQLGDFIAAEPIRVTFDFERASELAEEAHQQAEEDIQARMVRKSLEFPLHYGTGLQKLDDEERIKAYLKKHGIK